VQLAREELLLARERHGGAILERAASRSLPPSPSSYFFAPFLRTKAKGKSTSTPMR
jgi:hypothetical protein